MCELWCVLTWDRVVWISLIAALSYSSTSLKTLSTFSIGLVALPVLDVQGKVVLWGGERVLRWGGKHAGKGEGCILNMG